ncbi:hypothetical protein QBC37DRAFT_300937, partial [Rhypophila decipiens]
YITGHLTLSYALDTTTKEKPVLNVDDIYLILHHHWVHDRSKFPDEHQRIQFALMILLQSYTATRPKACYPTLGFNISKNDVVESGRGCIATSEKASLVSP